MGKVGHPTGRNPFRHPTPETRKAPPHPSRLTPCHLPPKGGKALRAALGAAPTICLWALRTRRLTTGPLILPIQARHHRGVCVPIGRTRGGSTNGGAGCRPPPAPDAGAMPKARVFRTGGKRQTVAPPGPESQAQSGNSARATMTQGMSGSGARRWSVRKHCRAGQVQENSLLGGSRIRGPGRVWPVGPRRSAAEP